jgi:hypothetical protein
LACRLSLSASGSRSGPSNVGAKAKNKENLERLRATILPAKEAATSKKPLKPDDFPVHVEGDKIKKQNGTPVAEAEDDTAATDIAERLNDDEARREEDKWSA